MILYNLATAIKKLRENGFKTWSDEHHVVRGLDSLETIFYAKYGLTISDFAFWIVNRRKHVQTLGKRTFLCAENISGFGYCFPVSK